MTLQEQIDFIAGHGDQAIDEVIETLTAHKATIKAGMEPRLIGGFPDYGDSSWHVSEQEMAQGLIEELIDAANWRCFDIYRRQHGYVVLPEPPDSPDD